MTPIERAARALEQRIHQPFSTACTISVEVHGHDQHPMWQDLVRAVIEAIREPSEAMIDAGEATDQIGNYEATHPLTPPALVWPAMIDALLAD